MKIILHVIALAAAATAADIYKDAEPKQVTTKDLHVITEFEKLALEIAEQQEKAHVNFREIFEFIWQHRLHVDDYSRLNLAGITELGRRTARSSGEGDTPDGELFPNDFNYYKVGLKLQYNFYDEKTEKDLTNDRIEYKSKIIDMIEKYASSKEKQHKLHVELKMKRLEQIRDKVRQKTAQIYLDDRLKTIEDILKLNNLIKEEKITCNSLALQLENLVKESQREALKAML